MYLFNSNYAINQIAYLCLESTLSCFYSRQLNFIGFLMNCFDVCSEATLPCKLITTKTAGILYSQVFGLLVYIEITLLCCLIVTLITLVLYSLVN